MILFVLFLHRNVPCFPVPRVYMSLPMALHMCPWLAPSVLSRTNNYSIQFPCVRRPGSVLEILAILPAWVLRITSR